MRRIRKTPTPTKSSSKDGEVEIIADRDAWVSKSKPTKNYGREKTLESDGESVKIAYMRFDLSKVDVTKIKSAKLKFRVTNSTKSAHKVKLVSDNDWSESEINYNNRPIPKKDTIARISRASKGKYQEVEVKSEVSKAKKYITFAIMTSESDGLDIGSREQSKKEYRPTLIVKYK
ncbi:MAG: DNRLRE domain-containing protein [Patescibacteria group bacterium]